VSGRRARLFICSSSRLGYGLTRDCLLSDEGQVRFYHILNEVFRFAYGKRSALGDEYDSQTDKNEQIEQVSRASAVCSVVAMGAVYSC
jgi:hypothetical protein